MVAYTDRAAALVRIEESVDASKRQAATIVGVQARDAAVDQNERPAQPRLSWQIGERGLRMNWSLEATAR